MAYCNVLNLRTPSLHVLIITLIAKHWQGTRLIINLRVVAKVPRSMRSQGDTTMTVSRSLPQFARNMNLQDSYELEDISTIRADFTE